MKNVYLYVLDTLADWEPAQITAELNSGRFFKTPGARLPVVTVGLDRTPVTTMGGLTVTPAATLADVTPDTTAAFLLPGSNVWDDPKHAPAVAKAKELLETDAVVAAICGATTALANAGVLDNRPHTSNGPGFLEMFCPAYKGASFYRNGRAVADGNLITASGTDALQWSRLILEKLDVFSPATLAAWHALYETGDPQYFYALMESLPKPR
jgi:putative intracellular protease/amidase